MDVSMIVAVARNGVIGLNGGIPWHVSEDSRYFKEVTMGKPVIMGRMTWESLNKPLPGRQNIVVSSTMAQGTAGATVVRDLEAAIAGVVQADEVFIMGGTALYNLGREIAARIYLTEIAASYDGDTWFTDLDPQTWIEVSRRGPEDKQPDDPDYSFVVYERRQP
jgi:dihydrofolate reductase